MNTTPKASTRQKRDTIGETIAAARLRDARLTFVRLLLLNVLAFYVAWLLATRG